MHFGIGVVEFLWLHLFSQFSMANEFPYQYLALSGFWNLACQSFTIRGQINTDPDLNYVHDHNASLM